MLSWEKVGAISDQALRLRLPLPSVRCPRTPGSVGHGSKLIALTSWTKLEPASWYVKS